MRDSGWIGSSALRASACLLVLAVSLAGCGSGGTVTKNGQAPSVARSTTTVATSTTLLPYGPAGGPVPAGFTAASVTFVSLQTGWVLGTAPCTSPPCTSVVRTRDGGKTWVGIPAPKVALSTDQLTGVHQIRFADADNGWAFGPELWATHDGGAHWDPVRLPGVVQDAPVSDLAASAGVVHVAVIDPSGVRILSSPVSTDAWQESPTVVPLGAGPVPQAQVVLQGSTGWLIDVDRTVIGGARLAGGSWTPWQPPCTDVGGPATLAASTATDLVAICSEGEWNSLPQVVRAYVSSNGGDTFRQAGVPLPLRCCAPAVASGVPGTAVVGASGDDGTAQLVATFDDGATWTGVYAGQAGQWNDLGFTSQSQGIAVQMQPDARSGSLLMTVDGGHTWNVVAIR